METSVTWLGRLAASPTDADWQRLVDAYSPLLAGWAARVGVPAADRDDLVQEVLVVVVRRVGAFERRGPGAFRAWLRCILANHVRKLCRARRAAPAVDLDLLAQDDSELARAWDREHDEYVAARAMRTVEGDFAPATWLAFRLQIVGGLPAAAAAAQAGLTLNATLLAKSRVLKRLRTELKGLVE